MQNYFSDCKTIDEAKNLFRKLCMTMHPDKGGNASEFIKMYDQFKKFRPTDSKENPEDFNAEKFYNIIQHFSSFEGLNISFVGSFIWIEGNTYQHKDELKKIILTDFNPIRYAKKKQAWYFSPTDYQKKSGKTTDLDEIKSKYGCNTFSTPQILKIA
ncbi:hypothetical protein J2810_004567 [Chryseobacterium rhizosphaerae]|uniref:hypothetical protein n=1 Tax=Chryseobacterium rhizosphaerae TaxID=395937 RepID=UPI00286548E6|nr:hypothetical protein [Chryseobacterium rhizosphaerae]MDR6548477.1 hypothetical protein [Chryseobacterium rhizosphaerae]